MLNNRFELEGKIFLVTGATSGIGYATSLLLLDLGCTLYALGRNEKRLKELEKRGKGKVISIKADLFEIINIDKSVSHIDGKIDGFIHSAGVVKATPLKFISQEHLNLERTINYDSFLFLVQTLVKRKKFAKNSSIVAVSSISAHFGMNGLSVYSGTKGALISTVRVLAKELALQQIRVNSISPGMIRTEMVTKVAGNVTDEALLIDEKKYPLGYGMPIDVAYCIAFLLSDASSWMTGQDIVLDGGRTCYI